MAMDLPADVESMGILESKEISVIIVTKGAGDYLRKCLSSLRGQSLPPGEIIVMDNSLDSSFSPAILREFPSVKVLSSPNNLYYGASLNKGLSLTRSQFVLCLNDDVVLGRDFILEAGKGFLLNENIGMVSGKILRMDGSILDSTGLFLTLWYSARERGYGRQDKGDFDRPGFVFGVSGSVAFYRRKMLEDIKEKGDYFDPEFKMFYEDLDISWRAHNRGWKAYYLPSAKAFHARGGSFRPAGGLGRPFARRYLDDDLHGELIKNRYLAFLKNASPFSIAARIIPILLYDFCAWSFILFFRPAALRAVFSKLRQSSRFGFDKQS
ncbi:MAG: glycosyltransferase family 2 protein [Candidatus Omnitrophota bacterium]